MCVLTSFIAVYLLLMSQEFRRWLSSRQSKSHAGGSESVALRERDMVELEERARKLDEKLMSAEKKRWEG